MQKIDFAVKKNHDVIYVFSKHLSTFALLCDLFIVCIIYNPVKRLFVMYSNLHHNRLMSFPLIRQFEYLQEEKTTSVAFHIFIFVNLLTGILFVSFARSRLYRLANRRFKETPL